jgi:prophage antirepressor-like protein
MTNTVQTFENQEFGNIRAVEINDEPWFVGKDVAIALGYSNTRDALARHVDDEDKGVANCDTPGGAQKLTVISESGLYSLVMSSKLEGAKRFKRWVTSEVLPSIRKHGAYITPSKLSELLSRPESITEMLSALLEEQKKNIKLSEQNLMLTEKNEELTPKGKYYDELVDIDSLMCLRDTAKALSISPKKMNDTLISKKYLYRQGSCGKLVPYEKNNCGYFVVKERKNTCGTWAGPQTFVTVAGRQMIMGMRDDGYFD